jgi:hypothetical protein
MLFNSMLDISSRFQIRVWWFKTAFAHRILYTHLDWDRIRLGCLNDIAQHGVTVRIGTASRFDSHDDFLSIVTIRFGLDAVRLALGFGSNGSCSTHKEWGATLFLRSRCLKGISCRQESDEEDG